MTLEELKADFTDSCIELEYDDVMNAIDKAYTLGKASWVEERPPFTLSDLRAYMNDYESGIISFGRMKELICSHFGTSKQELIELRKELEFQKDRVRTAIKDRDYFAKQLGTKPTKVTREQVFTKFKEDIYEFLCSNSVINDIEPKIRYALYNKLTDAILALISGEGKE